MQPLSNSGEWLRAFKVALIEKNVTGMQQLLDAIPEHYELSEYEEAQYLCNEAVTLLHGLKEETADTLRHLEKNLRFLEATQRTKTSLLDITS